MNEKPQERPLNNIFYPSISTLPSCFNLPYVGPKVPFGLSPHYTQMWTKSTNLDGIYLLLCQFEVLCSMMHFSNIPIDAIIMKLIHFAFKYSINGWICSLATNFISTWDNFIKLFLKKIFLIPKL